MTQKSQHELNEENANSISIFRNTCCKIEQAKYQKSYQHTKETTFQLEHNVSCLPIFLHHFSGNEFHYTINTTHLIRLNLTVQKQGNFMSACVAICILFILFNNCKLLQRNTLSLSDSTYKCRHFLSEMTSTQITNNESMSTLLNK